MRRALLIWLLLGVGTLAAAQSREAREQTLRERIRELDVSIAAAPRDAELLAQRASLYAALEEPAQAITDYDRAIAIEPSGKLYDARGSEHFKLGKIDESIADFDRAIGLNPDEEPWHWKRGISFYYAGQFDKGRKQFEGYQTVDDNDVENAVWRFLCMARRDGLERARAELLKIRRDPRVPMMEVYALFAGQLGPQEVLAAAAEGAPSAEELNARQFYAHLYLGLYYEAAGEPKLAKEHLRQAQSHRIGHYMWNVADVHVKRLAEGN